MWCGTPTEATADPDLRLCDPCKQDYELEHRMRQANG